MTELSKNAQVPQCDKTAVKCRFFAQYFGVRVFQNELNKQYNCVNYSYPLSIEKDFNKGIIEFLELKPLSKITDEDAKEIIRIENFIGVFEEIIIEDAFLELLIDIKKGRCNRYSVIDFLRSKGYALPFMQYSVEDLISFGWVQLV